MLSAKMATILCWPHCVMTNQPQSIVFKDLINNFEPHGLNHPYSKTLVYSSSKHSSYANINSMKNTNNKEKYTAGTTT